jgi:hypothetical protein
VPRIFISHSSRDVDAAARLRHWLADQSFDQLFLDFDKHLGIPPGDDWERRLYLEVARSHAVILVVTANWHESKWCWLEFTQARAQPANDTPTVRRTEIRLSVKARFNFFRDSAGFTIVMR